MENYYIRGDEVIKMIEMEQFRKCYNHRQISFLDVLERGEAKMMSLKVVKFLKPSA